MVAGMQGNRLTVYAYQELLDRGWRRSGTYLYRPDVAKSCCASYTIRLDSGLFEPTKKHLKVIRRFEQFLSGAPAPAGE